MYADTRTNSFGEYIPTLNQNHELLILSGVSEWDNLILDPRRSAVFDTQIRTNTHRDLYADTERRSESYCENTYPESQSSTTDIELDVQVDDCENNVHVYKSKTLEYLKDFDLTLKYDNISVDIDDINTDCNVNNTLELRLNNIPVGALGFLSDDSRFTKNIVTFMSFFVTRQKENFFQNKMPFEELDFDQCLDDDDCDVEVFDEKSVFDHTTNTKWNDIKTIEEESLSFCSWWPETASLILKGLYGLKVDKKCYHGVHENF